MQASIPRSADYRPVAIATSLNMIIYRHIRITRLTCKLTRIVCFSVRKPFPKNATKRLKALLHMTAGNIDNAYSMATCISYNFRMRTRENDVHSAPSLYVCVFIHNSNLQQISNGKGTHAQSKQVTYMQGIIFF